MSFTVRRTLCLVVLSLAAGNLHAETPTAISDNKVWDGYLGVGPYSMPDYPGGAHQRILFAPIANFDYDDIFYAHLDRAGIHLIGNDDHSFAFGLAAQPRFGFHAKDDPILAGMKTRRDAIEGGPTLEWEWPQISMSLAYFADVTNASGGHAVHLSFYHQWLDAGPWDIGVYLDFDHLSATTARYYFGVNADEATATRPAYLPSATTNTTLGLTGAYRFSNHRAVIYGLEGDWLGTAAVDSPIAQTRLGYTAYLGIGYAF